MFSTKTGRLGPLWLTLALSLPQTFDSVKAQGVNSQTPRGERGGNSAESGQVRALSEERIAQMLTASHVGLTMTREGNPGFGSGVLIKPSPRMEQFLCPDEVLVLSVSHNLSDWGDQSRVYGTLFTPENAVAGRRKMKREDFGARVIGRFMQNDREQTIFPTSSRNVDVAFLALRIPDEAVQRVKSRALSLSEGAPGYIRTGSVVYATGSRGQDNDPLGKGVRVAQPNFRKGIVLTPTSPSTVAAVVTQFGKIPDDVALTTIECMPGDSGGALAVVNTVSGKLEVVGVCSAGGSRVELVDFPIDSLGLTQEEIGRYGLEGAVLRRLPGAKAPHRGFFTGLKAIKSLESVLVDRYQELQRDLKNIDRVYLELKSSHPGEQSSPSGLETLYQRARARSVGELEQMKPSRG